MLSDVTIGQYLPGDSLIHKMDPRMKIVLVILLMVSVFVCKNYISLAILFAFSLIVCAFSKIKIKVILKGIKPLLLIILITLLLNLFYGSGEPLAKLGRLAITENGINNAVFMCARILFLIFFGMMLTYTTTPTSLTDALESLLKPLKIFHIDVNSVAMIMTIALRFIPTLIEEVDKIISAQKSRGADMETGGLLKRVSAVVPVMIPLFVSSFRRANELEYAMECRCYRGGDGRTKMNVMHLNYKDYISLAIVVVYFAGIICTRILLENVI